MMNILFISFALASVVVVNTSNNFDGKARIIDGNVVAKKKYYEVAIVSTEDTEDLVQICTGALVGTRWVLTSGYCAARKEILTVQYGSNAIDISGNTGIFVRKKFVHPYFLEGSLVNDIALLEIEPVTDSTGLSILTIPVSTTDKYLGKIGIVSGWGATGSFNPYETTLNSKQVFIIDNSYCAQSYCCMNSNKLCTAGRSICEGDQGAPLVLGNEIIGVASANVNALNCATMTSVPYTRVSYYSAWIRSIINRK